MNRNRLFGRIVHKPAARLRIFCFPYAGGGASIYQSWGRLFSSGIEIYHVQLPGRENRVKEAPYADFPVAIDHLIRDLKDYFDKPFVFFGHSMGALFVYALAVRLRARGSAAQPLLLFVSGRATPQSVEAGDKTYRLDHDAFVEKVREIGGLPDVALQHPELRELVLPILRADFCLCETYRYQPNPPLTIPITVYAGADDPHERRPNLIPWDEVTTAPVRRRILPGGHFFINTHRDQVIAALAQDLAPVMDHGGAAPLWAKTVSTEKVQVY